MTCPETNISEADDAAATKQVDDVAVEVGFSEQVGVSAVEVESSEQIDVTDVSE